MNGASFAEAPISEAGEEDAGNAASILSEAFADDPVMNWTFGGNRAHRTAFLELARGIYLKQGFGHLAGDQAATLWLPAGTTGKLPFLNELRLAFSAVRAAGFGVIARAKSVAEVMEKAHPQAPHYYLFAVGVRKAGQGKGLGGRIIREGLKKADADGAPAYLENSNPKNTALYERLGFSAIAPLGLPAGAPPLLGMLRKPEGALS